jgi:hypothetical protein
MNADKQRIAIAEACGWQESKLVEYSIYGVVDKGNGWHFSGREPAYEKDGKRARVDVLPDYSSDLNAMNMAENGMTDGQHNLFRGMLSEITKRVPHECDMNDRSFTSATAAQRAEAFLRALNLWKP